MSMLDEMRFDDIEPITVPVTLGKVQYMLHEPSGEAVGAYRDKLLERTQLDSEGNPIKFGGVAQADLILLSYCLKCATIERTPAETLAVVQAMPERITGKLIDRLKEISEFNKPGAAKLPLSDSESPSIGDGSDSPAT